MRINPSSDNPKELVNLREQEASLRDEISSSKSEYSSTQASATEENSMIDMQISENASLGTDADSSLSSAQSGQSTAESRLNNAANAESTAANDKNAKDQNYNITQNNFFSAQSAYNQTEGQVNAAQGALSNAVNFVNSAQANVSTCESDVASAQAKAQAAENKSGLEKLWDGICNFVKGLWDAVTNLVKKLDEAKSKLQEALGIKVDKEKCLELAKGVSQDAKDQLQERKQECDKAQELAWAAQTVLEAATGAREVSQQELNAAMQIVAQAQEEKERLSAEGQNLQTQKSEIQEKYDALLSQISDVIAGKEAELQDIINSINALQTETTNATGEIAVQEELEAKLSAMTTELMAKNEAQTGFSNTANMFGSLFGGGPKGDVAQLEEYKKMLEEAIMSGDRDKLDEIYKKMTEGDNKSTAEELKNAQSEEELTAAIAKIPGVENKQMYINALNSGDQAEIDRVLKLIEGTGLTDDIIQEAAMSKFVGSMLDDETKQDLVEELKKQADALSSGIDSTVGGQGAISWGLGKANNLFGIGTTENMSRAQIAEYQERVNKLLEDLENGDVDNFEARYKAITGETLSLKSISELKEGNNKVSDSKASQSIDQYKDTQESVKTAVVGTAVAIGAVALTAVTFGGAAPLLLGALVAGGIAAGLTVGINAIDGWNVDGSGYTYTWEEAGKDALTGFVSGSIGHLSAGLGGKITAAITKKLGGEVIKQTAATTAKEFLIKQGITAANKFVGDTVAGIGEGAVTNAARYGIDCMFGDKQWNWDEFGTTTLQGGLAGGATASIMSFATSTVGLGIGLHQFNKEMVKIDADGLKFLEKQVKDGYLDPSALKNVSQSGRITQSMLDDINLAKYAQENNMPLIDAYIPQYDAASLASAQLKPGDVFECDGKLFIAPNGSSSEMTQLNITRQDYFDLFPPMQRFATAQQGSGDCYLVVDIAEAYDSPTGRTELLKFFSKEGDNIVVEFPGGNGARTVFQNGSLDDIPNVGKYTAKGAKGVQMIEVAYGHALQMRDANIYRNYLLREISKFSDADALGRLAEAEDLYDCIPQKSSIIQKAQSFYNDPSRVAKLSELEDQLADFLQESSRLDYNKVVTYNTQTGVPQLTTVEDAAKMFTIPGRSYTAYTNSGEYLRGNGGNPAQTSRIFGFNSQSVGSIHFADNAAEYYIRTDAYGNQSSYWGGTTAKGTGFENILDPKKGLVSSHAYKITPLADGTFNIVNPHGTTFQTNLTVEEIKKWFSSIYITKYA